MKFFGTVTFVVFISCCAWDAGTVWVAKTWPQWAWQHGSPDMQQHAAGVLVRSVAQGSSIDEIIQVLGPGSNGWPKKMPRRVAGFGMMEFGIRSEHENFGIEVAYEDGKVLWAKIYD